MGEVDHPSLSFGEVSTEWSRTSTPVPLWHAQGHTFLVTVLFIYCGFFNRPVETSGPVPVIP